MSKLLPSIAHDELPDDRTFAAHELEDDSVVVAQPFDDETHGPHDSHEAHEAHDAPVNDERRAQDVAERLPVVVRRAPTREELQDPLALYARALADAPAMTPQEERVAAAAIVALDIAVWERLLADTRIARTTLDAVLPQLERVPRELVALRRTLVAVTGRKASAKAARAARVRAVGRAASKLRALDADRRLVNAATEAAGGLAAGAAARGPRARAFESVRQARRAADVARDEFVRRNLRLVMSMARRYRVHGMPLLDLVQEGNLGLLKALDRFDPQRGFRFSTYAVWWIRHHINRAMADKSRMVRVPVHRQDRHNEIERARRRLIGELGREPALDELAHATGVDVEQLQQIGALRFERVVSLDSPRAGEEDDDRSRYDWFQDPHAEAPSAVEALSRISDLTRLRAAMDHLKPIEVAVLRKRFGMGGVDERTLADIGAEHGLSRERIRQIEQQALERLRKAMNVTAENH